MPGYDSLVPESGLMKDELGRTRARNLAEAIAGRLKSFDKDTFLKRVLVDEFYTMELKARITHIAHTLREFMPKDFKRTAKILTTVSPQLGGWENWVLTTYVEHFGVDHFDDSVCAMEILTRHGTCEFCVRPFLLRYQDRMLEVMLNWAEHENEHVRRLAAEGTRPRGVWMPHIPAFRKDPSLVVPVLEKLKADESLYVRKAVANNLNDISRDNPNVALKVARAWKADRNKHTDWIVKHGCRTLIKQGHPDVFPLLGFTAKPQLKLVKFAAKPKKLKIGGTLELIVEIKSTAKSKQKLALDYVVYYQKKNGKISPKVFKWCELTVAPGDTVSRTTTHKFVERSTRKHLPGEHRFELQINGRVVAETSSQLTR